MTGPLGPLSAQTTTLTSPSAVETVHGSHHVHSHSHSNSLALLSANTQRIDKRQHNMPVSTQPSAHGT